MQEQERGRFLFPSGLPWHRVPGTDYTVETRRLKISADNEDYSLPFTILAAPSALERKILVILTEINQAEYEEIASPELLAQGEAVLLPTQFANRGWAGRFLSSSSRLAASGNPTLEAGSLQLALDPLTASPNEDPASDGDPPATVSFTVSLQDKDGNATTHELADLQYELVAFKPQCDLRRGFLLRQRRLARGHQRRSQGGGNAQGGGGQQYPRGHDFGRRGGRARGVRSTSDSRLFFPLTRILSSSRTRTQRRPPSPSLPAMR